jgi:transcriptional regulator with XRE-family HTH domain
MHGLYNVLFLCTGNSARSIMAEAIMNHKGRPNFAAYSAGSHPKGSVHPAALKQLENARLSTDGYRSKNWEEFSRRELCNFERQYVGRIERGERVISFEGMMRIAFNLQVTPAELYKQIPVPNRMPKKGEYKGQKKSGTKKVPL